jgi:uncharacterized protein
VNPNASQRPKPRRADIGRDQSLCEFCTAKCCRYFALAIDTPKTQSDYDYMRWYLLHERATLFTDNGTWYLQMHTTCKHLLPDHRCGIYHDRPPICREYQTADCEYPDDWQYDRYFETAEQIAEYAEAVVPKAAGQSIRGPRPALLPVAG